MKYIAICGTVGAGKTTLLQRLTAYFGPRAAFHEERPQDNPYINEYYSDSKRWSFHSQVSFLSLYFDDEKWRPEVGDTEFFFFDRAFLENLVIAKYRLNQQDLTQDEFGILCKLAHGIASLMPPVDKYLYLDCSVSTIIEHMGIRGRSRPHVCVRAQGALRRMGQNPPAGADAAHQHGRRGIRSE